MYYLRGSSGISREAFSEFPNQKSETQNPTSPKPWVLGETASLKVSKKLKWFYEDIVSPNNQRNYFKDFCLISARAEIFKIIALLFGRNDVFIKSFRFLLTFSVKSNDAYLHIYQILYIFS